MKEQQPIRPLFERQPLTPVEITNQRGEVVIFAEDRFGKGKAFKKEPEPDPTTEFQSILEFGLK